MKKLQNKFHEIYSRFSKILEKAELSAIAAAIQNTILMAEHLKIGTCWLDTPLFCKEKINKFLATKNELIAIISLGYPMENGRRSPRKSLLEAVEFID